MNLDQHTHSVILNYLLMGVIAYVCIRWLRVKKRNVEGASSPIPLNKEKRSLHVLISLAIAALIVGVVFFVPEWMGRKDATAVCESISVGAKFPFDQESLNTYRHEQKARFSNLFAASYFPKSKEMMDGTGAVILVFLAGFPFSRAYCVLNLNEGVIESTRLMFNAEDYTYCDGEMRGVWECKP